MPFATRKNPKEWRKLLAALEKLHAARIEARTE
jgi:hypothetical protein